MREPWCAARVHRFPSNRVAQEEARMCGIMGYFEKTSRREAAIGATMLRMLTALGRRGPDSAGVALYARRADGAYRVRVKLGEHGDMQERAAAVLQCVRAGATIYEHEHTDEYLRLALDFTGDPQALQAHIEAVHPEIEVISCGRALDLVKQVGSPYNLD